MPPLKQKLFGVQSPFYTLFAGVLKKNFLNSNDTTFFTNSKNLLVVIWRPVRAIYSTTEKYSLMISVKTQQNEGLQGIRRFIQ
jgi:hypothetical protein